MKRIILILLMAVAIKYATAQTIEVNHGETTESFKIAEIDCITHEFRGENLVRLVWHDGNVVSESPVSIGDEICYKKAIPTIIGIWDAVEKYETQEYGQWVVKTHTYVIEFKEDGTFTKSDTSFEKSTWSYSPSTGSFSAKGFTIADMYQVSWDRFTGNADDIDNPMKITGVRYEGNVNTVANVEEKKGDFELTRRM